VALGPRPHSGRARVDQAMAKHRQSPLHSGRERVPRTHGRGLATLAVQPHGSDEPLSERVRPPRPAHGHIGVPLEGHAVRLSAGSGQLPVVLLRHILRQRHVGHPPSARDGRLLWRRVAGPVFEVGNRGSAGSSVGVSAHVVGCGLRTPASRSRHRVSHEHQGRHREGAGDHQRHHAEVHALGSSDGSVGQDRRRQSRRGRTSSFAVPGACASCGSLIDAFSGSRARSGAQAGSQVEELLPRAAPQHPRHHRSYHQTAPCRVWIRRLVPVLSPGQGSAHQARLRGGRADHLHGQETRALGGPSSRGSTRPWPSFDSGSPPTLQSAPAATGEEQGWTCRK